MNLNIFTLSGETIGTPKKITEGRYSFEVSGLTKGKEAAIRVSYVLENSSGYIRRELAAINVTKYSQTVKGLVSLSQAALDADDTSTALAKLNEAKAEMKKEDTEIARVEKALTKIKGELKAELDEINKAIVQAKASGSNGNIGPINASFLSKLTIRASEIDSKLKESESGKLPADALRDLEALDPKWLDNQVKSIRKGAFDSYNLLRTRLANTGNSLTPNEFIEVELGMDKLEASGNLENAVSLLGSIAKAETVVKNQEDIATAAKASLKNDFSAIRDSVRSDIQIYAQESAAAKGSDLSPLFKWTEKTVEAKINDAEKAIASSDLQSAQDKVGLLNRTAQDISLTLDTLKNQSDNRVDLVKKLFDSTKDRMDSADADVLKAKIAKLDGLVSSRQYVNAIKTGDALLTDIGKAKKEDSNIMLLLGVSAIAILAVLGIYMMKQKEGLKGGEPKKTLKKLGRAEEAGRPPDSSLETK
jgi:hypothetical protein